MTEDRKIEAAWEVYLYARDLLAKRMSYGMIAQSMLLIAFSTLAIGRSNGGFLVAFFHCVIATLGIIYTSYHYFRVRVLNDKLKYLEKTYLLSEGLVFKEYLEFTPRQRFSREFSQATIILVFLSVWVVMLIGALFLKPA